MKKTPIDEKKGNITFKSLYYYNNYTNLFEIHIITSRKFYTKIQFHARFLDIKNMKR